MNFAMRLTMGLLIAGLTGLARADEPAPAPLSVIEVHADQPAGVISRWLTGACIEDVNHEIYGGLYSQMVFGESFQEPESSTDQIQRFQALGGQWTAEAGELSVTGDNGDKLISASPAFLDGEVGVEVFIPERGLTNAGLVVRVGNARRPGADNFDGYEIALNSERQDVFLARHRQNFTSLKTAPCEVPTGQWATLVARLQGSAIEVLVNGKSVLQFDDGQAALPAGTVGLRQWQSEARYRNLWIKADGAKQMLPFEAESRAPQNVSGQWRAVQAGDAKGRFALITDRPFVGAQSQRITLVEGRGRIGVENQGLNRWGMHFAEGKPYEGEVWARAEKPVELLVSLESRDGSRSLAEQCLAVAAGDWQRLSFALTPTAGGEGRLTLALSEPGTVDLGYVLLQPGEWGRFAGLPVRKDVAEAMIDQGLTFLRYGGSMVNHREYRWKKMIGPRERRPPHHGTWYPHSTNGWAIPDFLNFCEAAGFEAIPTFNMDETPEDMVDFLRYATDPADSEWGRRRAADGHPGPYRLTHLQLGNEERVDETYFRKFQPLAEAIWAVDPEIVLVVGDFDYREPIRDPDQFGGTSSGIHSLAAHRQILELARRHNREVWFDVHVWTDGPRPDATLPGTLSLIDALETLAEGARFKVVVFELNANSHGMRRALANALAIQAFERDGRLPVVASANALQPDGQNDNGWDQGLLFLNPSQVWLQPPGYVTQMFARNFQPQRIPCQVSGSEGILDVAAKKSSDGRTLVLQVVNPTDQPAPAVINLAGYSPTRDIARVTELSGALTDRNTAENPRAVVPVERDWTHGLQEGRASCTFPPRSVTVIRWE